MYEKHFIVRPSDEFIPVLGALFPHLLETLFETERGRTEFCCNTFLTLGDISFLIASK